jgi:hypothetical protein
MACATVYTSTFGEELLDNCNMRPSTMSRDVLLSAVMPNSSDRASFLASLNRSCLGGIYNGKPSYKSASVIRSFVLESRTGGISDIRPIASRVAWRLLCSRTEG